MKRVLLVSAMVIACSAVHAESVHLNQNSLMLLRKMCGSVLVQLVPADMMYVQDYTMNEYLNRDSGAVVGLDVISKNPRDATNIHSCHYDFIIVKQDGTPDVAKMFVDLVPVNINIGVSPDSSTPTSSTTPSVSVPRQ
jgi:hypothetical protein